MVQPTGAGAPPRASPDNFVVSHPWPGLEAWLRDHRRLVLAIIIAASVLVRIPYFLEINHSPCVWQHRWSQTDMNFFDLWAKNIAAGDWLTDKVLHPWHEWHKSIAAAYLRLHPEAVSSQEPVRPAGASPAEPFRVLWERWWGGKNFHQEPLYPYLVALTYQVFGPDVRWVFVWQLLLGVAGNVLIYLIALRHFGALTAAAASLLAVLCSPLLFYNLVLLRETTITFLGLGLVYLADLTLDRRTWRWWLLLGLTCGLGVLLRTTFLLFWLAMLALAVCRQWRTTGTLLRSTAALTVGLLISLSPLVARNLAVGVPALSLPGMGAITFICANAEDSIPEAGSYFSIQHGAAIMGQTGGRFLPSVVATLQTHPSPWSYLNLEWRKFTLIWHWYEIPNNTNFYSYRLHSKVLRYLPVTYFILGPLSLMGLALALSRGIPCWPLYLAVAGNLVMVLLSFVLSRYRITLVALLLPFAALTLVQIAAWAWSRRWIACQVAILALILLSLWTMRPLPPGQMLIRPADYIMPYYFYYYPLVQQAAKQGDGSRAVHLAEESLRLQPEAVRQMAGSRPARDPEEVRLAEWFADVELLYAQVLAPCDPKLARELEQRAAALRKAARGYRSGR